jgi:Protein of unknown function (DUF2971)
MSQWLYKYTTAGTAVSILLRKKLRWSAPELFNDPFEFKNPFQFNFDWPAAEISLVENLIRLVTQVVEPQLVEHSPTTARIRELRAEYKARRQLDPILVELRRAAATMIELEKSLEPKYAQKWREMKQKYRVICFSEIATNILMWSHYSDGHKGVVLGFQIDKDVTTNISYHKRVPPSFAVEDYIGFLTSQRPIPDAQKAFETSVYTKSEEWSYEREIRGFRTRGVSPGLFDDFEFDPGELKEICFGCRTLDSAKEEVIAAARTFQAPIVFFQMQDEPLGFELTPVPLKVR